MELNKKQMEILRWYSAGHSLQMIEQYVDLDRRDIRKELEAMGVTNTSEAFQMLNEAKDGSDQLDPSTRAENLPNAGEPVPEFKPETPNATKLSDYDKREIAERGGNQVDLIPMAQQHAFRMDIRWRTLSEVQNKWLKYTDHDEEKLKAAVREYSPSAFKRLYGED